MSKNDKTQRSADDEAEARRKRLQPRVLNTNARFTSYLTSELRSDQSSVRFGYMTKG